MENFEEIDRELQLIQSNDENQKEASSLSSTTPDEMVIEEWCDLDIHPDLLRSIYACGYEKPSPIQRKAIFPILHKKDVIGQAQSGTGKTATFSIGALALVDVSSQTTQILVLSPTRELSIQTADVLTKLSSMMKGVVVDVFVGGIPLHEDKVRLETSCPHVVVGCPGRIYDLIKRQHIVSENFKMLILDEADEMLSAGFKDQIYNIFQTLNPNVQVLLFTATLPPHIEALSAKFMRDPIKIIVKKEQLTLEGIRQFFVAIENDRQKYDTLKDLYGSISISQCIIYCNSVKRVQDLNDSLRNDKFPVCCIHSDMEKVERDEAFRDFRNGKYRVLVSSNVTARGIDIQQVSVVINFDVPRSVDTYLHRIGRSGRWGRKGVGINLVTKSDIPKMREIERFYATQIEELPQSFVV